MVNLSIEKNAYIYIYNNIILGETVSFSFMLIIIWITNNCRHFEPTHEYIHIIYQNKLKLT